MTDFSVNQAYAGRKGFLGVVFGALRNAYLGGAENARYLDALYKEPYVFEAEDTLLAEYDAAVDHVEARLRDVGFDPAESVQDVAGAVNTAHRNQFGIFERERAEYLAERRAHAAAADAYRRDEPARGSADHIRREAQRTFMRTGVYGLPSYGGYILTNAERQQYGLTG